MFFFVFRLFYPLLSAAKDQNRHRPELSVIMGPISSTQINPTQPNPWVDPTHEQLWHKSPSSPQSRGTWVRRSHILVKKTLYGCKRVIQNGTGGPRRRDHRGTAYKFFGGRGWAPTAVFGDLSQPYAAAVLKFILLAMLHYVWCQWHLWYPHCYLNPSLSSPHSPSITHSLFHSKLKTCLFHLILSTIDLSPWALRTDFLG